jgi:hypothetical protein
VYLQLIRESLVGDTVRPKGFIFQAEGRKAETFVRNKAAIPAPAPTEAAINEPRGERAVSKR